MVGTSNQSVPEMAIEVMLRTAGGYGSPLSFQRRSCLVTMQNLEDQRLKKHGAIKGCSSPHKLWYNMRLPSDVNVGVL